MSDRPRRAKTPKRNALDVSFHLRNARISLARLEGAPATPEQRLATHGLRRRLDQAITASDTIRETYT